MITRIGNNSISEGRSLSRLPKLSNEWIEKIRGSADFLGMNYYTSRYVEEPREPMGENPSIERDGGFIVNINPKWPKGGSPWLYSVPEGLSDILRYLGDWFIAYFVWFIA